MSQQSVERILGRLITDAGFRDRFFTEPGDICREDAVDLTPVELAGVLRIHPAALEAMAARLDRRIVRARPLSGTCARPPVSRSGGVR